MSVFAAVLAEEMEGAKHDAARSTLELRKVIDFTDLGYHPTAAEIDAEVDRLFTPESHDRSQADAE
jgi:hypothetical protein